MESTVAALQALVDAGVEELRVIQTVFLMASMATFIKGKVLVKVCVCGEGEGGGGGRRGKEGKRGVRSEKGITGKALC